MDTVSILQLVILVVLLFLSAFFSSAETCLTTVNKMRLKSMADEGYENGFYSNTVNLVWQHMTKLCNRSTTIMKSNGVPAAACTSFTTNFKKWFKSYYNA